MPRRNSLISRLRLGRAWDEWDENGDGEDTVAPVPVPESTKPRSRRRRAAVAMTFSALFVAGAAFSATAGDQVRSSLEDSAVSGLASTDGTTTDTTATTPTTPTTPSDPAPVTDSGSGSDGGALAPATGSGDSGDSAPAPDTAVPPAASPPVSVPASPVAAQAAVQKAATRSGSVARLAKPTVSKQRSRRKYARTMSVRARQHHFPARKQSSPAPAPELEGASAGVVWLNTPLSDPTPPALRLKPRFAKHLRTVAEASHVNWALMLGVLRAEGHSGAAPANLDGLRAVAAQLSQAGGMKASPWAAMFSFSRDTTFADRTVALSHY